MIFGCKRRVVRRNATYDRCNTLLAEFLRERSARRQAIAHEREEQAHKLESDHEIPNDKFTLSEDLIFKIFIVLPAESLYRMQFVCKKWFGFINCSNFINYHAHESETVLICQTLAISSLPFDEKPKPYIPYFHFVDLEYGSDSFIESNLVDRVRILASCNGLVLAKVKNESLVLTNPVTRKHTELPLGTGTDFISESYSLASCNEAKKYKVVHLFFTRLRYIGCEIISINTREWKTIDGPSSDLLGPYDIKKGPLSVGGSLYWLAQRNGCDYLVTMNVENEKFITEQLPVACNVGDRLVESGGVLGLVTHATNHMIEFWILVKGGELEENWIKRYSINLMNFGYGSLVPICSPKNGKELVFACLDDNLYVYNFEKDEMKMIYSRGNTEEWFHEGIQNLFIPHRNTLASWEDQSS